jgi:phosphoheptose isomerase
MRCPMVARRCKGHFVGGPDDTVVAHFRRSRETLARVAGDERLRAAICGIADTVAQTFHNGGKLMLAGNGGSVVAAHAICGLVERNLFGGRAASAAG